MNRKDFIHQSGMVAAGVWISRKTALGLQTSAFPVIRTAIENRKFTSKAVEQLILEIQKSKVSRDIAWLFENCFPNTLDTTVDFSIINGKPDTYVITGDIDAMWLRDSTAQVWPYLPLCKDDKDLQQLIKGVINRQVKCILLDPYANAFYKDEKKVSEWKTDLTDMKPGIHERKWEIDSLCYPIRLSCGYYQTTQDLTVFDSHWMKSIQLILQTFREQQRWKDKGPYSFQRTTSWATDGVPLEGYGYPVKPNGLICSMFRPSDDATLFPYLIPSNLFVAAVLKQLIQLPLSQTIEWKKITEDAINLHNEIQKAVQQEAIIKHPVFGDIYAYEINGFGSHHLMDDANIPSLISLPYLGALKNTDPVYRNTRKYLLSEHNPFFFKGKTAEGIGGPHAGINMIWPLGIIMRGLTSNDPHEIKYCLQMLQLSNAGTGYMHESFHKDDSMQFTRKWFAWANTLFGEFVWKVYRESPSLLQ